MYIRCTKNRKHRRIPVGFWVYQNSWKDGKVNERVRTRTQQELRRAYNISIQGTINALRLLEIELENPTLEQLVTCFVYSHNFYEYFERDCQEQKALATRKKYHVALRKLQGFRKELKFEDLTSQFLKDYERHLKAIGNSDNTVCVNMAVIRAVVNRARLESIKVPESFDLYKPPKTSVIRKARALTFEELIKLETWEPEAPGYLKHKRIFLISCYTGLRISDVVTLHSEEVKGLYIDLTARKTGKRGKWLLTQSILDQLPEKEGYIFDFGIKSQDRDHIDQRIRSATGEANKYLKWIAEKIGIPKFTTHSGRHTFNEMGLKFGLPAEIMRDLTSIVR